MSRQFFLFGLLFFLSWEAQSQFIQLGNGSFSGTIAGPIIARNNVGNYQSKYAYIFPESVLDNMKHGDSLTSLEFYRTAGATFNANCSLKIWLNNTSLADWGANPISFNRETNSASEVYYNHPQTHIGPDDRFYKLPFDKPFVFDTTKGNNLVLLVYFEQFDTIKGNVRFYFEGSTSISGYYSPQVRYSIGTSADDSLRNVTEYHPTIRFSFPKENQDLHVQKVYTLGKIPVPLGNPDSVKVLLRNVGKQDLTAYKLYTYSKGKNKLRDSFLVTLPKGNEAIVNVPSLNPSSQGTDTVYVESTDNNTTNNLASSVRWANENIYSYRDITQSPAPGGIGFNGQKGDFVARFQSNQPKNLNQISVMFSGSGRLFKLGIWEHDSTRSMPGKLLWDSDSLITKGGTYILDLPKPVRVNGSFYVGVRQLDLNNVAFGYQMEQPVRPKTFFYAVPNGDTNWVDFSPDAPYRFIIEPRLQADYDVKAISVSLPKDTFNVHVKDTFAPTAMVANIGVNDISDSFRIRCTIKGPNVWHYDESIYDTISSGRNRTYTLPKKFAPWEYGTHTLMLIVSHWRDQVVDNDTVFKTFVVGSSKDVMIRNAFPSGTGTLVARKDTLLPISTIMNIAFNNSGNFPVVSEIWMGDSLMIRETQTIQLGPLGTQILVWKTFPCNDTGRLRWIVYTKLSGDEYTLNDTAIYRAFIYKVIDVVPDRIISPDSSNTYQRDKAITVRGRVYNEGVLRADSVKLIAQIFTPLGVLEYQDSMIRNVDGISYNNFNFQRNYTPKNLGIYRVKMFIKDSMDLYRDNDTLESVFYVGRAVDYQVDSISLPATMGTTAVGIPWSVVVSNIGYENNATKAKIETQIQRNQTTWLEETVSVNLMAGQSQRINFTKAFKPLFTGDYEARVVVTHPSDLNRQNDTIWKWIQVRIAKDAWLDSLTAPLMQQRYYLNDTLHKASVFVRNQGTDTMHKVIINSQLTFEKAIYFQQSDTVSLAPGAMKTMEYNIKRSFNQVGLGQHKVWITAIEDENHTNDTITHPYEVRSKRDLDIYYVDSPSANGFYVTNTKLYPYLYLRNKGMDSLVSSGTLVLEIKKEQQVWYTERIPYPMINPGDTQVVQATQVVYFVDQGNYQLRCFAENNQDENALNDTLSFEFVLHQNRLKEIEGTWNHYPNPVNNKEVTVLSSGQISHVTMLDVLGRSHPVKLDRPKEPQNNQYRVHWHQELSPGTYYLIVITNNTRVNLPIIVP